MKYYLQGKKDSAIEYIRKRSTGCISLVLLLTGSFSLQAAAPHPEWSSDWMLATPNQYATDAGALMLEQGGNAVDAAVAVAFALGVVEMYSSGIGGGAFLLHYNGSSGEVTALDGREKAPAAATADMFLDPVTCVPRPDLSLAGAMSVAVPGQVALLFQSHQRWGQLPWATLLEPATRLAEDGFPLDITWIKRLNDNREKLLAFRGTRELFF